MPMTKLYFRHDFHARSNPKLIDINMTFGMEGIGIYWTLLEMFYENDGFVSEKDLKLMCFEVHIDFNKAKKILELAEFTCDKNGIFSKKGILDRIDKREETSKKMKNIASQRWDGKPKKHEAPIPDWMQEKQEMAQKAKEMSAEEKEQIKKIFE